MLLKAETNTEVPGFFFSIRDILPESNDSIFYFLAGEPLQPETDYVAQAAIEVHARAEDKSAGIVSDVDFLQWQFRTGK